MILGSKGILKAKEIGDIFISPFSEKSLNPNSYDVSIDAPYYMQRSHPDDLLIVEPNINPQDQWILRAYTEMKDGRKCVLLKPREMILATTIEVIGAYNNYTTLLKAKSTIARLGLDVCASAGFGDIGYVNKWTLEIVNHNNYKVAIPQGTKVAQICFIMVEGQGQVYNGSYKQSQTVSWVPENMLPVVKPKIVLEEALWKK